MPWVSGAVFTNPTAGTLLVDTGPLPISVHTNSYTFAVFVRSSIGIEVLVQWRNAANDANNSQQIFPCVLSWAPWVFPFPLRVTNNERLRVVARADVTGEVQASILYT